MLKNNPAIICFLAYLIRRKTSTGVAHDSNFLVLKASFYQRLNNPLYVYYNDADLIKMIHIIKWNRKMIIALTWNFKPLVCVRDRTKAA
ncbi:hypothetical protein D4492_05465 [Salmonella enterica subsp. enterica serovar Gloucester]|nr:hypothetical protein [Salmonella enterica subsp. enterica serovar Gloucester]